MHKYASFTLNNIPMKLNYYFTQETVSSLITVYGN